MFLSRSPMFFRSLGRCSSSASNANGSSSSSSSNQSRFRACRVVLYTSLVGASAAVGASVYYARTPVPLTVNDPKKKTLVVLGSGWGTVSFLQKLDTSEFNTVVVSPRNYFLYTPLLPSVATGNLEARSIITPIKQFFRSKSSGVQFVEANATVIDPIAKHVEITDISDDKGSAVKAKVPYDYLVVGVGAESQTFGIKGVRENTVFLKELEDGKRIREKIIDCIEKAAFPGQPPQEVERLLHMVVVGGGPTGVEYAGQLYDFMRDEVHKWYPELASKVKISLVEAMPNILPMFTKEMIDYAQSSFKEMNVQVLNNTCVKEVRPTEALVADKATGQRSLPFGLMVWATGNTMRPVIKDFISKVSEQDCRRGVLIDEYLRVKGAKDVWAIGDCTATSLPPTAQVATQQGVFLARQLGDLALSQRVGKDVASLCPPFKYKHLAKLAYIGNERAVTDLNVPVLEKEYSFSGYPSYIFWKSAYLSNLLTMKNRVLVAFDWTKNAVFGRDISRT